LCTRAHPDRPGSVGRPLAGVAIRVVDPDGKQLPPNTTGEIVVSSPSLMVGYYRLDNETAAVRRGDWLATGDLGRQDCEGFLYVTGRKKNLIIRAGCNVQPEEVEQCLQLHPAVASALVLGEADRIAGEQIVAYVVPQPLADCTAADLLAHCRSLLSAYKVPSRIEIVPDLVRTSNGKLKRVRPALRA